MKVVRFYQAPLPSTPLHSAPLLSSPLFSSPPLLVPSSPPCQLQFGVGYTLTACAKSQWAVPDLNSKRQIAVGAGPQLQAPERSGHCRTSTARARSQWAIPDLNSKRQIKVGTAGSQQQVPDRSARSEFMSNSIECHKKWFCLICVLSCAPLLAFPLEWNICVTLFKAA